MRYVVRISILFFFSLNANALESTNCSDPFGSIRRVELEVSGPNPVTFRVGGSVVGGLLTLQAAEIGGRQIISTKVDLTSKSTTTIYVTKLRLSRKDNSAVYEVDGVPPVFIVESEVICEHYSDLNPD